MAKKWSELTSKMDPERSARVQARVRKVLKEMPLHKLRAARELTQKQMAATMQIDQGAVSRMERRTDLYVSTLRNFVEAMGGELEIVARFPDGFVKITDIGGLGVTAEGAPAE